MATTRWTLTSAWTDLGPGPLLIEDNQVGLVFVAADVAAPAAASTDGIRLHYANPRVTIGQAGQHVYARAADTSGSITATEVSSSSGGGPATIADGANVTQGAKADAAATDSTSAWSLVSLLKGLYAALIAPTPAGANNIGVVGIQDGLMPNGVTGYSLSAAGQFGTTWDRTGYPALSVQVSAIAAGSTVVLEGTNDGVTWAAVAGNSVATTGASADVSSMTAVGIYRFVVAEKYCRLRQSVYGGTGTTTVIPLFSATELPARAIYVAASANLPVLPVVASTSGGMTLTSRLLSSAATTNPTVAKASAGRMYRIEAYNTTASVKYLKLFNKASSPTFGTDTPVRTIPLLPGVTTVRDWSDIGYYFSAGISWGITGALADNDNTALAAGDVTCVHIDYA